MPVAQFSRIRSSNFIKNLFIIGNLLLIEFNMMTYAVILKTSEKNPEKFCPFTSLDAERPFLTFIFMILDVLKFKKFYR